MCLVGTGELPVRIVLVVFELVDIEKTMKDIAFEVSHIADFDLIRLLGCISRAQNTDVTPEVRDFGILVAGYGTRHEYIEKCRTRTQRGVAVR